MKQLLAIIAFSAQLLTAVPVAAERLPAWYPDELREPFNLHYSSGVIDEIDFEQHKIIINDRAYNFSKNTTVQSLSSRNDSQGRLRQGVKVGFRLDAPMPQGKNIETFWLLPTQFTPDAP